MTARLPLLTLSLWLALPPGPCRGAEPEPACRPRCETPACLVEAGRCLLRQQRFRPAKALLKGAVARSPDQAELSLLLARAYWGLGNRVWAKRVLAAARQRRPRDCQVRSWLVWLHLGQAELEAAGELLAEPGCPRTEPMKGRWELLRGTLARFRKDRPEAAARLEAARQMEALFAEDLHLLDQLEAHLGPRPAPVRLRLDLGGGYTTNGLMSNPAAVASLGQDVDTGSPVLSVDALVQLAPPWGRTVRPLLELGLRSLILPLSSAVSPSSQVTPLDYSYLGLSVRPGLALGPVRLFYSGQLFLLAGGDKYEDGPRWFYETHRGEVEWDPLPWLTLWGGAGRSLFHEQVRSRTELDLGGGVVGMAWRLRLLGGLSLRKHWAGEHQAQSSAEELHAYDLFGGSFIGTATLPTAYLTARVRLVLSLDLHHDSASYFKDRRGDPVAEDRQDLLLKGGGELWSPGWHGLRAGLSYEVSHRMSNVDAYQYTDHRILLRLRWTFELDPWRPGEVGAGAGHVALPVEASGSGALEDERIQDLLRQEDAARRGSTCLN